MIVTVCAATPDEAAALSRVGMRSFNDAYRGTANDDDIDSHLEEYFSEAAIRREMMLPTVRYFVATRGPTTAGLVKLRKGGAPAQLPEKNSIEVQQLYVASEHQRTGIGRKLLDAAIAEARAQRARGIWLSAWTHADWAVSFYRGYGFGVICEVPFLLGRSEFTDYLMWYPLD